MMNEVSESNSLRIAIEKMEIGLKDMEQKLIWNKKLDNPSTDLQAKKEEEEEEYITVKDKLLHHLT